MNDPLELIILLAQAQSEYRQWKADRRRCARAEGHWERRCRELRDALGGHVQIVHMKLKPPPES